MSESDPEATRIEFEGDARAISLLELDLTSSFRVFYTMDEHINLSQTQALLEEITEGFKATFKDVDAFNSTLRLYKFKLGFFRILDDVQPRVFRGIRACDAIGIFKSIEYMTDIRDYFKAHNEVDPGKELPAEVETKFSGLVELSHHGLPVVPMTQAVASQLPPGEIRFNTPYVVYLLELIDRYACNFDMTRTYENYDDDAFTFGRTPWDPIIISGCPGGAFLCNPLTICRPCKNLRTEQAQKNYDENLVKKFEGRRHLRLRSIDVWLAEGRKIGRRKRQPFDNNEMIPRPLTFAPRKVALSKYQHENDTQSHRRWRLRRSQVPSFGPPKKLAANIIHTLHFQSKYVASRDSEANSCAIEKRRHNTMDNNQMLTGPWSLHDKHCHNYAARPGSVPIETVYVFEGSPTTLKHLQRQKHVSGKMLSGIIGII
ncbi:hypothetical protein CPB84DRAFT_1959736 [Gymnopilus junonius]|uniref:Uncharacterized protein n=1 Tax=Gymnopilus junonius TaxID=109634 RepID=A0A9P5NXA5_GYMJU|nr:hypothetical protein CPB84DRAFT_1959736 [Gymnopilus junonius]